LNIRSDNSSRASLRSRVAISGFIAVWVLAFLPTWNQWARVWWTSPSYDFGLALAALTLWALLVRRHGLQPRPETRWIGPLAAISLLWMFTWLAGIAAAQQLAVVGWGLVALCALYGWAAARRILPAIAWLAFASEIWEHLSVPLQALVVRVVPPVMAVLGLPSVVSGNRIQIPAGIFIVEEGCSGVKYLIALLAFVCVLLYQQRYRWKARVLLVVTAVGMALLANWFRVCVLIAVGQATHMQHPMLRSHAMFGWIVFAVALVPVVLLARRFGEPEDPVPAAAPSGSWSPGRLALLSIGLVGSALAATLLWLPPAATPPTPAPPSGWTARDVLPAGLPVPGGLDLDVRELTSAAGTVRAGWVHSPVPARPEGLEVLFGAMAPGQPRTFTTLGRKGKILGPEDRVTKFSEREMVQTDGLRKVQRFWFDVAGRSYSGSAVAKAVLAVEAPLGTRFMTIHAVQTECRDNCDAARVLLDQFMSTGP
jgi:exosortase